MYQTTLKLVQRLKGKNRVTMCNHKLRDTCTHTQEDKKLNMEGMNNNGNNYRLYSNLSDHQLKINCYKHSLVYMKHIVTINQKFTRYIQEIKKKESKHNPTVSHQHTGEASKRIRNNYKNNQKTISGNNHISINIYFKRK
uniref:Uncharacterized protein n=1 Tax=Rousettus aegyptiacus TaxID=9407 RepID=A0A7J8C2G1_ROUAE|nr:hypothetical protein HJG63_009358 [Rousettus aegyptiacus]